MLYNKQQINTISGKDEERIKTYFIELGYNVEKLDIDNKHKRPDFLICNIDRNLEFNLEVKSFFVQKEFERKDYIEKYIQGLFKPNVTCGWQLYMHINDVFNCKIRDIKMRVKSFEKIVNNSLSESDKNIKENLPDGLEFKLLPELPASYKSVFIGATMLNARDRIRSIIKSAYKQFKAVVDTNRPNVLIIVNQDFFPNVDSLDQALKGDYTVAFSRDLKTEPRGGPS